MKIYTLEASVFGTNTYLVADEHTGKAVLIDPDGDGKQIAALLKNNGFELQAILLTHGHFDHISAVDALAADGIPVYISEKDKELLTDGRKNASSLFFGKETLCKTKTKSIQDGDVLTFGALSFTVLATPGHTRGSVCFFVDDNIVFTGDTIFAEGYGRTDLYGGDTRALFRTLDMLTPRLKGKVIYPGHGESTVL